MLETLLPEQTYFSISEVSELTGVKPYVIRYWESQFSILRPARRDSGQRKFTQKEIDAIRRIKELLYDQGFTIAGARKLMKQTSRKAVAQLKLDLGDSVSDSRVLDALRSARKDLEEAVRLLKV
jgi:DNA-binding transcriptional MerR regulator